MVLEIRTVPRGSKHEGTVAPNMEGLRPRGLRPQDLRPQGLRPQGLLPGVDANRARGLRSLGVVRARRKVIDFYYSFDDV